MREYPDFKFTASAAQAYVWMEEKYPAIFSEIEQRVKEGRWEIVGGMWVEPDLNMPDGESLVRQILYGKRYFKQKFGVDVNIGWNPDSFGYNCAVAANLQALGNRLFRHAEAAVGLGVHHVSLSPLLVAGARRHPPDDLLPQRLRQRHRSSEDGDATRPPTAPLMWKYNGGTNSAPDGALQMMYLYGVGDHGGGPTRVDLDTALRWQKSDVVYPKLEFSTAASFLDNLSKNESELNLPGVERRTLLPVPPRRADHAVGNQARQPQGRSRAARCRKTSVDRHALRPALPAGRLRFVVEEGAVQPVPRHPARLGHRHQLCGRGAEVRRGAALQQRHAMPPRCRVGFAAILAAHVKTADA